MPREVVPNTREQWVVLPCLHLGHRTAPQDVHLAPAGGLLAVSCWGHEHGAAVNGAVQVFLCRSQLSLNVSLNKRIPGPSRHFSREPSPSGANSV